MPRSRSSSSSVPRIACSGLFSSCATPDTSTPTAASRSWRTTWRCSDCSVSRILPLLLHLVIEREVRFAQVGGHRDERLLQLRQLAVRHRRPLRRRQIAVGDPLHRGAQAVDAARHRRRQAEREQQDGADGDRDDRQVAPEERRRRAATARLVGMPTLSSHGPRSTTALPYERSTLSSAGPHLRARHVARRGRIRAGRLADVQLGVAAARQHPAVLVRQRHHRAFRQRDVAEQRLQAREVEAEAEHADERALRRCAPDTTARWSAGCEIRPVISSLTCGLPVRTTSLT